MAARPSSLEELVSNGEVSERLDDRLHDFSCTPLDTMSQEDCVPLDTNDFLESSYGKRGSYVAARSISGRKSSEDSPARRFGSGEKRVSGKAVLAHLVRF
jgi:hypothetical protein